MSYFGGGSGAFESALFHAQDQKASGTVGGPAVVGWQKRTINTVVLNEIPGADLLVSNNITLPAGEYYIVASFSINSANKSRLRVYDETNSAVKFVGRTEYTQTGHDVVWSELAGRFSVAAEADFSITHYSGNTTNTNHFGIPATTGDAEIYSDVKVWKIG